MLANPDMFISRRDANRIWSGGLSRSGKAILVLATIVALGAAGFSCAQPVKPTSPPVPPSLTDEQAQAMVKRVLQVELEDAQASAQSHPLQYKLRKQSPRLATTKIIVESKDGDVARLIAINDAPLSAEDEQKENARLQGLLDDPGLQHHRQQREQGDTERARKVMRALPDAFLYTYAGVVDTPQGPSYKLSFQPNPDFDPQDLEAQVLKGMAGEMWIDVGQQRVTRLHGKRLNDVDYGWGIIGKLDQGGTLLLEQADIGNHQWRTTHMALVMNGRAFWKTIKLDTTLDLSQFTPVASGLSYQQAIQLLRSSPAGPTPAVEPGK